MWIPRRSLLYFFVYARVVAVNASYIYSENEIAEFNLPNAWQPGGSGKKLSIDGYAPTSGGPFPTYIWLPGTGQGHWSNDDKTYAMDMARRGFVAASADYNNRNYPTTCQGFNDKARDTFGPESWSAIAAVCALENADCDKGIAVSGFSQGANVANLAKNYNPDVKAAYLIGNVEPTVADCWDEGDTTISKSFVRSVMGENDGYSGMTYETVATSLESTTGYYRGIDCAPDAYDCIQTDGSGWYIVQGGETASGGAGHCFQYENDSCSNTFDSKYYPDSATEFGMVKSHEWLSSSLFYLSGTEAPTISSSPSMAPSVSNKPSISMEPSIGEVEECTTYRRRKACVADINCEWSNRSCVEKS